ncbi:hypothetical protein RZS08_38470, partial [Arthrospira platensis SPKY1]|nr:hypothetical protein [Arthrospira platensis SPKY1]
MSRPQEGQNRRDSGHLVFVWPSPCYAVVRRKPIMTRPMFDEMNASDGEVRAHYESYARWLA